MSRYTDQPKPRLASLKGNFLISCHAGVAGQQPKKNKTWHALRVEICGLQPVLLRSADQQPAE